MRTVQEIQRAIGDLAPEQLEELYSWLDQHHPPQIDTQLAVDLHAGRLDRAILQTLADDTANQVRPSSKPR